MHPGAAHGSPLHAPSSLTADVTNGLDPAQLAAVTTPSTLVAVIAGAGSGKTRVLTNRIAYRIAAGTADARHTLALTFTREAAGELRRRLRRTGVRDHVEAGTFHAVALALLRQRWADIGQRPPTIVSDRLRLIAEVADGVPVPALAGEADWAAARGITPDRYVNGARAAGRRGATPPDRIADRLGAYETLKRRRGVVDLDDLLALAARELATQPAWADAVRFRFRHVLVDEAQDLNPVQYRFLEGIVGGRNDLYLVGDPAQAIYGFNGSDPALLADIADRLPGVEIIHLPTNHRCTPQIVAAGIHVLRAGLSDGPQDSYGGSAVSSRPDGPSVRVLAADDEAHEGSLVAAFVRSLDPSIVRTADVAVLARTNNQLRVLTEVLESAALPIRRRPLARGSPLALAVQTAAGQTSATRLRTWAHDTFDVDTHGSLDPTVMSERRVAGAVLEFLRDQPLGDGAALRSWVAATNPFEDIVDLAGVELLTFHAAKGREWNTVVVTGVETGLVPIRTASTIAQRIEESRLLHVALTRASDRLVITWSKRRGGYGRKPSSLLAGLDVEPVPLLPPPPELRTFERPRDRPLEELRAWRDRSARGAALLPDELCSEAELTAIAAAGPRSPDELAAITGFGMLTATRLYPAIRAALDDAGS